MQRADNGERRTCRYGRKIPDGIYSTNEFERILSLKARTEAVAKHLTDFLTKTDRFAKTIVFCVDQEHAEDMRIRQILSKYWTRDTHQG